MRTLGKLIAALVGIFAIVILVVPFAIGFWLKSHDIDAMTEVMNANPNIHAELADYKRGWFSSDLTTKVTIYVNENAHAAHSLRDDIDLTPVHFTLHTLLKHGPFLFDKDQEGGRFHLGWGLAHTTVVDPKMDLRADSRVGFGKIVHQLISPKLLLDLSSMQINMQALNAVATQSLDMKSLTFNGAMQQASFEVKAGNKPTDKPVTLTMDQVKLQGHSKRQGFFNLGEGFLQMQNAQVTQGKDVVKVDSPKAHWQVSIVDNKLTIDLMSSVNKVSIQDKASGPYHLNYKLSDMDVPVLTKIVENVRAQSKAHKINSAQLMPQLMALIMKGINFDLDVYGALPKNEVVALKGQATLAANDKPSLGILSLISGLKVDANITVPERVIVSYLAGYMHQKQQASQLPQTDADVSKDQLAAEEIKGWETQGLVKRQAPNLTTKLTLDGGQFAVNGQTLNLFSLKSMLK